MLRRRRRGSRDTLSRLLRRFAFGAMVSIGILAVGSAALGLLDPPRTFAVIRGETEHLEYYVAHPKVARFATGGFRIRSFDDAIDDTCAPPTGMLEPRLRQRVAYAYVSGRLQIAIGDPEGDDDVETAVIFTPAAPLSLMGPVQLVRDDACPGRQAGRFPVWGAGRVGETFNTARAASLALSLDIEMYGKSAALPPVLSGGEVYAVYDEPVKAPLGTELTPIGYDPQDPDFDPGAVTPLRGALTPGDSAFRADLVTEASVVFIRTPGDLADAPTRLGATRLTQLARDPNLSRLQALLLAFALVLPIALEVLTPPPAVRDEPDPEERP